MRKFENKVVVIKDNTISVKRTSKDLKTILPALLKLRGMSTDVLVFAKGGKTLVVAGRKLIDFDKDVFGNFEESFLPEELINGYMSKGGASSTFNSKYTYPSIPINNQEQIPYIIQTLQRLFNEIHVEYEKITVDDEDYNASKNYSQDLFQASVEHYLCRLLDIGTEDIYEIPEYCYLLNSILNNFNDRDEFNTFIEEQFKDDLEDYEDNVNMFTDRYDFGPWTK